MAGQPNPNQNTDLFEAYFKRADLDGDGQISGAEAVAFFQGSGLPKNVLAQVWMHADQRKAGYLGRQEFYNALKLVTVAQSKRELIPDIVKAALYGPASAKIPAPQINLAATPAPKVATPSPQLPAAVSTSSQSVGLRQPQASGGYVGARPQYTPPQQNHLMKPLQSMPPNTPQQLLSSQGMPQGAIMSTPRPPSSSISTDLLGADTVSQTSQSFNRGITPPVTQDGFGLSASGLSTTTQPRPQVTSAQIPSTPLKLQSAVMDSNQGKSKDPVVGVSSGNGLSSGSHFGDVFSATPAQTMKSSTSVTSSASSSVVSSVGLPSTVIRQPSVQSAALPLPMGGQTAGRYSQQGAQGVGTATATSATSSGGTGNSVASHPQSPWPKMTQTDIQKYIKVFMQVDSDRDGKITGEQARSLFLSWRLPREILKQVWDLSDQDNDSMLSMMEFCIALYLMERYREGRPLPTALPKSIMSDETLLSATSHPRGSYGAQTWGPAAGPRQPQVMAGARSVPATAKPPRPPTAPQVDEKPQALPKPKVPELEKHLVDQLSQEEQDTLSAKFQEASQADKKVEELEKEISDSRQKIEFYRAKMQELVIYKSQCDNRLNEVTARVSSDRREAEALAKKYEEKYKQAGDVASKLTIEEATFRDIQEKKMDLYRAIVKLEAGEPSDEVLKERAQSVQAGLEELVKSVNERCKQYGLRSKPTALVELPFGWQPGIQEGAADWDEDWDEFEDEGFTFVKELTIDVQNVIAPPKPKCTLEKKSASAEGGLSDADVNKEKVQSPKEKGPEKESEVENGETKSPHASPSRRTKEENESSEREGSPFKEKTGADGSPRDKQVHCEAGHAESAVSVDKGVDEPKWGSFDTHFDKDALWGFDSASGKDADFDKSSEFSIPGFGDFSLNPIKTGTKTDSTAKNTSIFADSVPSTPAYTQGMGSFNFDSVPSTPASNQGMGSFNFDSVPSTPAYNQGMGSFNFDSVPSTPAYNQGKSSFNFDSVPSTPAYNQGMGSFNFDSVPSTPAYNQGNTSNAFADSVPSTPAYNFGNFDNTFDSFSRFDSFNTHDSGSFHSPRHSLSRFDSIRSNTDSEQNYGFATSFDSFRESRDADHSRGFSTFDSFRDSEANHGFSRFDSFRETDQSHGFSKFDSFRESTGSNQTHGFSRFDSFKDGESGVSQAPYDSFSRYESFHGDSDKGFSSLDDNDPFGSSGPFKSSGETPKKSTDDWRAF